MNDASTVRLTCAGFCDPRKRACSVLGCAPAATLRSENYTQRVRGDSRRGTRIRTCFSQPRQVISKLCFTNSTSSSRYSSIFDSNIR